MGRPASANGSAAYAQRSFAGRPEVYARLRFRIVSKAANSYAIVLRLMNASGGVANLAITPSGTLKLRNELLATDVWGGPSVSQGVWHTLDLRLLVGASNGRSQVWLDGIQVGAFNLTLRRGPLRSHGSRSGIELATDVRRGIRQRHRVVDAVKRILSSRSSPSVSARYRRMSRLRSSIGA